MDPPGAQHNENLEPVRIIPRATASLAANCPRKQALRVKKIACHSKDMRVRLQMLSEVTI
jgi:hypothetical protein